MAPCKNTALLVEHIVMNARDREVVQEYFRSGLLRVLSGSRCTTNMTRKSRLLKQQRRRPLQDAR